MTKFAHGHKHQHGHGHGHGHGQDTDMDTDLTWTFLVRLGVTSHYWLPVKNILGLYKVKILFPTFGYLYRTDLNYFY